MLALEVKLAYKTGDYISSLRIAEILAQRGEEAEVDEHGVAGIETARYLTYVARHALFARNFSRALDVSDRAIDLNPSYLIAETNRAHALLFLGRADEARALYIKYKDKPVQENDNKPWQQVVANDFAAFRNAGLQHPLMAEIETVLGISKQ